MSGNLEAPVKKTSRSLSSIPEKKLFWKRDRIAFCSWRTKKNVLKYGEPSSSPCALDPEPSSSTCVPVRCPDPGAGTERPCSSDEGSPAGMAVSLGEEAESKAADVTGQDPGEGSSVRLVQKGRASAEAGQDGRTLPLRAGSSGSGRRRVFFTSGRLPFGRERAGGILGRRSLNTSPGASTRAAFPPVCLKDTQSRPREAASSMKRVWCCVSWGRCCPCL
nr:PREDICTED: uncharacterized protein LOC107077690 [Lepisosteus oculatus]